MKYAVFFLALLAMPLLGVALSFNRRWMRYAIWAMIGALAVYQNTAINFFSYEDYRGSSRGMEVSIVYLLAFALLALVLFFDAIKALMAIRDTEYAEEIMSSWT